MVKKTHDPQAIDIFSRPIAGQSLTDAPGKWPFEKPPKVTSPTQAFELVKDSLEDPSAYEDIMNLLDVGISAETLASSLTLKMFTEGVFTPDIAEIIKPPLVAHITEMGVEGGIEDINVGNEMPDEGITPQDSMALMSKINPDKLNRKMSQQMQEDQLHEALMELEIPEEEMNPPKESFLDMEVQ